MRTVYTSISRLQRLRVTFPRLPNRRDEFNNLFVDGFFFFFVTLNWAFFEIRKWRFQYLNSPLKKKKKWGRKKKCYPHVRSVCSLEACDEQRNRYGDDHLDRAPGTRHRWKGTDSGGFSFCLTYWIHKELSKKHTHTKRKEEWYSEMIH